ncbi:YdhR family protein [Emcibacter nanhaiensis]|uniref:Monooxygenase n=1 Tax=Emcibacter nanhaiensis TaxID=1505037 RepID=A0A501PC97_9PROT|nr:YdhR family protein [Emcibacter nanhaiensis]TPD57524.1 hypothetical protein FIV46_15530 [Emcibacter nanhaiensis]
MFIHIVRFESELSYDEVLSVAKERNPAFETVPGLLQKYYVAMEQPNTYGGIYVWETKEAQAAYRNSDLFSTVAAAYKVKGSPSVEVMDCLFPLRS